MKEKFIQNELLSKHTNFRIGGPAKYFFEAKSSEEMVSAAEWALEVGEPFFILGGGSNTLISDRGVNGLVIKAGNRNYVLDRESGKAFAEAGVISTFFARKLAEAGLTGFEWAVSLPGTIGGAVRGNAGCFGGETRDCLTNIDIFDVKLGRRYVLDVRKAEFSYRESIFKHTNNIILGAEFNFAKADAKTCLRHIEHNLALRKEKQPLASSSAGCIFKNYKFIAEPQFYGEIPKEFLHKKIIPAGWLIEQAGIKGLARGGAEVSSKHGNFIINTNHASAADVQALIFAIKKVAKQKFNIDLQEEIQCVGF